jgi:putative ABC transport system ATP-binding protein
MRIVLSVSNLSKTFRSGDHDLTVLSDISFELGAGDTCAIVGPSGSGKTTLLGLCAGLDRPSTGRVTLCSYQLGSLSEDERASVRNEHVGFVFQSFRLIPTLTALENVMVPGELRKKPDVRLIAEDLLAKVGLSERADHYPVQLSGGEKQRVGLARAFVNQPEILFADEPTGNLDADTGTAVVDLLFDLNRTANTTLILVTHDIELASRCDRIIRLRSGKIEQETKALQ